MKFNLETPLRYTNFFSGSEATLLSAAKPCDQQFLNTLIGDLQANIYLLIKGIKNVQTVNQDMSEQAILARNKIEKIISECRRLQAAPQLFPSDESKEDFFQLVNKLGKFIGHFKRTVDPRAQSGITTGHLAQTPGPTQQLAAIAAPHALAAGNNGGIIHQLPPFHPDKPDGKNPWNNWLDNSARDVRGWILLQQKIPLTGDKLIRQITMLYDAVEMEFSQNNLVLKHHESTDQIAAPGDAFRHMSWSGFYTVPRFNVGFKNGGRKQQDCNGIDTIEHFSVALCKKMGGSGVRLGVQNIPYFRFAMGYRIYY